MSEHFTNPPVHPGGFLLGLLQSSRGTAGLSVRQALFWNAINVRQIDPFGPGLRSQLDGAHRLSPRRAGDASVSGIAHGPGSIGGVNNSDNDQSGIRIMCSRTSFEVQI
jgi:hypothetical protein